MLAQQVTKFVTVLGIFTLARSRCSPEHVFPERQRAVGDSEI
jgi:hypothetical protein